MKKSNNTQRIITENNEGFRKYISLLWVVPRTQSHRRFLSCAI